MTFPPHLSPARKRSSQSSSPQGASQLVLPLFTDAFLENSDAGPDHENLLPDQSNAEIPACALDETRMHLPAPLYPSVECPSSEKRPGSGEGSSVVLSWCFPAPPEKLLRAIERCVTRYSQWGTSSSDEGFWHLAALLCAKFYEEQTGTRAPQFQATGKEAETDQGCLAIQQRVMKLLTQVQEAYPALLPAGRELPFSPEHLAWLVQELGAYPLLQTELEPFGVLYQQWATAWARGDRAQFFTPLGVAYQLVSLLQPQPWERCSTTINLWTGTIKLWTTTI